MLDAGIQLAAWRLSVFGLNGVSREALPFLTFPIAVFDTALFGRRIMKDENGEAEIVRKE